jgi:hypothetical protein
VVKPVASGENDFRNLAEPLPVGHR